MSKPQGGAEKKEVGKQEHAPTKAVPTHIGCQYKGCKVDVWRFGFCPEHFEQFKFGLIKKTGEPVLDYEKKLEHYSAYKTKISAKKVA